MPKKRIKFAKPDGPNFFATARGRLATSIVAIAILPALYGVVPGWRLFISGRWQQPETLLVFWSAVASGLLCSCSMLTLLIGVPTDPTDENGPPQAAVWFTRLTILLVAALFGFGIALLVMTALPEILVSALCNFGTGHDSTIATICRISFTRGPIITFEGGGFIALVLAAFVLYGATKRYQK